jgi:hypothetical protein
MLPTRVVVLLAVVTLQAAAAAVAEAHISRL